MSYKRDNDIAEFTLEIPWSNRTALGFGLFSLVAVIIALCKVMEEGLSGTDFVPLAFAGLAAVIAIMHWRNSTWFFTDRGKLYLRSGPFWPLPVKSFSPTDFDQFYVKEVVHRHRERTTIQHELRAKLHTGKDLKISGQLSKEDALEYARRLEQALGINR